ncbi:VOC family protein [Neobacillus sp. SuZ13]|uniref:VOC family protein n=1 Tax=Neobacillus sp. SuZ13 TaxID=3047875 RepID=UPI0024BF5F60|nr:VOC family protein [Neobacillus sp. SuZ13]WHY67276.1 VOC family protein [Neobacillus sp. SuZ13]
MRFHHYGLEVNNLEESVAFYKKHLGLQEECRIFFMGEIIVFLTAGNFRLELISNRHEEKHAHLCFEVNDLNEVIDQFNGNRKIEGPYKLTNGWETLFYEGPNNEVIEFLQAKPDL